jgi:RNA polymerase sigma-70 factor (ECF subfamily)
MALMVVLETLSPLERAVFVLNEVFGYAHTEIAGILDRSPAAVRQLAHRAREHVQARRPRFQTDPQVQQQVTERFVEAVIGGDLNALMEVLAPDVTMWADGGGKARAAGLRSLQGREKIARLIVGDANRRPIPELGVSFRRINGDPSALLLSGDTPYAVIVLDLSADGSQVAGIYAVTNPDKLSHLATTGENR